MKTIRLFGLLVASLFFLTVNAKEKTTTFKVSGNCGMCKKTIEKAARIEGVKTFNWDKDKKVANVTFDDSITSLATIQRKIAASGYDTQLFKADDKAYNNLHSCCQYERVPLK